jgi:hypothetical protein
LDATGLITADAGVSVTGNIDILAEGDLRLQDASGGQYAALQAPTTISSSYTLTLPADDGDADQVLSTNGSGVLDWVTSGGLYSTWVVAPAHHTVQASGEQIICNHASTGINVTLPAGATGYTVTIKNVGAALVTVVRNGSEKINSVNENATMPTGNAAQLVWTGDAAIGWTVL